MVLVRAKLVDMSSHPSDLRNLRNPAVVVAFYGWNDAGNAATACAEHLCEQYPSEEAFSLDSEDYYDYQVNRPTLTRPEPGVCQIEWPTTTVSVAHLPSRDVVVVLGPEPSMRWRQFVTSIVSALRVVEPDAVVVLGALLADSPHSRPIQISSTSTDLLVAEKYTLEASTYEGPTGITGIFADQVARAGMNVISLWAAVPHYVAQPPSPKASLALLRRLEDMLDVPIDLGGLPELSQAWERGVDELAAEDSEVAEYITTLESQTDEAELPEASGDAIAAEFERYLRRRGG